VVCATPDRETQVPVVDHPGTAAPAGGDQ
jgi:hypothetical protein